MHVHLPLPSDCPPRPPGSDRPPLVGVYIGVHWQKIRIRATCSHTNYVAAEIGIRCVLDVDFQSVYPMSRTLNSTVYQRSIN